ncbi:hypothetical protein C8J57DRAFT_1574421 [Mycena rebaudengoi]|nr:hypothetical protein C8J57DRAFT_1574421 [Mycena rebaudengoi]
MSKRKILPKKAPDEHATYRPTNIVEIREKNRVQVAERRAAAKLKKRQWDPPKLTLVDADTSRTSEKASGRDPSLDLVGSFQDTQVPHASSSDGGASNVLLSDVQDIRHRSCPIRPEDASGDATPALENPVSGDGRNNWPHPSPTPDELIAIEALTGMHTAPLRDEQDVSKGEDYDSILALAQVRTSLCSSSELRLSALPAPPSTGLLGKAAPVPVSAASRVPVKLTSRSKSSTSTGLERQSPAVQYTSILEETNSGRSDGRHGWISSDQEANVQLWCNSVARSSREGQGNISQSGSKESVRNEERFYDYGNAYVLGTGTSSEEEANVQLQRGSSLITARSPP